MATFLKLYPLSSSGNPGRSESLRSKLPNERLAAINQMEDGPKLYCSAYWATVKVLISKPKDILLPMSSQEKNLGEKTPFQMACKGRSKSEAGGGRKMRYLDYKYWGLRFAIKLFAFFFGVIEMVPLHDSSGKRFFRKNLPDI
jgi:hypothetical protein